MWTLPNSDSEVVWKTLHIRKQLTVGKLQLWWACYSPLRVSFLHLRRCVPGDTTPSSYVCCGTPHAPNPCAVRSVHEIRCATQLLEAAGYWNNTVSAGLSNYVKMTSSVSLTTSLGLRSDRCQRSCRVNIALECYRWSKWFIGNVSTATVTRLHPKERGW